jgi:hypothetical protein
LALGFSPSFPLCVTDALPGGCTHLSPFALGGFRRGGWCGAATIQHLPDFGNLFVYPALLFFKAEYSGGENFSSELLFWHVVSSESNSLPLI